MLTPCWSPFRVWLLLPGILELPKAAQVYSCFGAPHLLMKQQILDQPSDLESALFDLTAVFGTALGRILAQMERMNLNLVNLDVTLAAVFAEP